MSCYLVYVLVYNLTRPLSFMLKVVYKKIYCFYRPVCYLFLTTDCQSSECLRRNVGSLKLENLGENVRLLVGLYRDI